MYDSRQYNRRQKIAIVGTGISGLSAAWHLHRHADITVFEKDSAPGGHSHSVNVGTDSEPLWVDMGFIVFNTPCYPNLTALFDHLGVTHQLSDMSFGVSIDEGDLEYASVSLSGLLAQWRNVARPRFLKLLWDLMRFYKQAPIDKASTTCDDLTLGQYLKRKRYSRAFVEDHLLPQAAAIWSTSAAEIMDYPFRAFITFFENHGLLKLTDRIHWRTVTGGSQAYVKALIAPFRDRIRTGCGIVSATRHAGGVTLTDQHGEHHDFDQVVFASHAHDTLRILTDADATERDILGQFHYTDNTVVLHTDEALMPKRKHAWSSWNYIGREDEVSSGRMLCVTYWMNLLQGIERIPKSVQRFSDSNARQNQNQGRDLFVTLNPVRPVDPAKIIKTMQFDHPLFNQAAIAAQHRLGEIQGARKTWFCGAYFGSGFHEDGLQSGLAVAEAITGVERPWAFDWGRSRIHWRPEMSVALEAAE
ncbi:FAD-dependent oxidoreductase [Asticcacaulis sp. BYS171W]|uniref:FAD-dependent oxidoreductase n=1 Tax=Asticcacaulis aquaticus TaxID=2984212 RepID=A0ABT5HV53_9CAUL|nr:FAD-dependent oxidoreductase [Asticcacaulis aquaticus]MDC7683955.1 FAD-dependent oxidoreductase [Asticcacaulis aquaticus]